MGDKKTKATTAAKAVQPDPVAALQRRVRDLEQALHSLRMELGAKLGVMFGED